MDLRWTTAVLLGGTLWGCDPMSGYPADAGVDGDAVAGDAGVPPDGLTPDAAAEAGLEPLRLDHVQLRGTVNSNHDYDPRTTDPMLLYRHGPFEEQGTAQDIRQFDFDLWGNGHALGVLHYDAVDDHATVCDAFVTCLRGIAAFRQTHPDHLPLVLLIGETLPILEDDPNPFFWHVDEIELSLLDIFERDDILAPADVRGDHPDLATAIEVDGWPPIDEVRGKIIAVLNERDAARQRYIERGGMDPDDRFLWQIGDPNAELPDEVIYSFERADAATLPTIARLVAAGRLVHATTNDPAMAPQLRAAGVHMLASRWTADVLGPLDPHPARCNPVRAPEHCRPEDIERRVVFDDAE